MTSPAWAQDETAEVETEDEETEPLPEEQPPQLNEQPALEPVEEPVPEPVSTEVIEVTEPGEETEAEAEAEDSGLPAWLDGFTLGAFADVYVQGIWTLPDPLSGDRSDLLGYRAYDRNAGFTISFVGLDVSYQYQNVGARIDLRFGTSVPALLGAYSGLPDGVEFVKQGYVFWRPLDNLQIDFGQFDTIYGAEVSESWKNHTYSRGSLYNVVQPFYHAGLRVAWQPIPGLSVNGLLVNGWNNVLDNNDGKTFGIQVGYAGDNFRVIGGYLTGPEQADEEGLWRHFGDLIVGFTFAPFDVWLNADYSAEDLGDGSYDQAWGVALSGRVALSDMFGVALRGEIIGNPDDATIGPPQSTELYTATLSFEALPHPNLSIRLDNRVDVASYDRVQDPDGNPSETVFSTTLGVVAHTN